MDPATGALSLVAFLDMDAETTPKFYELVVRASDLGTPRTQHESVSVLVSLVDVNDHKPVIVEPFAGQEFAVPENLDPDTAPVILTVSCLPICAS